jgi:hypothetical protein
MLKNRWFRLSLFGIIGMGLGYAYYYYVGCASGACPITSNPIIASGYGLGAGLLVGWESKKEKK